MTAADHAASAEDAVPDRIYRHSALTRATHWINALSLFVLLLSGLNIFMAEPGLFLGQYADFAHPAARIFAAHGPGGELIGVTEIGDAQFITTGVLGGYTTFSTFSLESALLIERGAYLQATAYVAGSAVLSILAIFVGFWIVRGLYG